VRATAASVSLMMVVGIETRIYEVKGFNARAKGCILKISKTPL
jgi:hypothetical protein